MSHRRAAFAFVIAIGILMGAYLGTVRALDNFWGNVPIEFYGSAIDQDGNPVPNLAVEGYVQAFKRLSIPVMGAENTTTWRISATTDGGGNFKIHGARGRSLHLMSATSPGYSGFTEVDYYYGSGTAQPPYISDPNHPATFHLWKRRGAEHHEYRDMQFYAKPDGRPYVFDLVKQGHDEGADAPGDLRVTVRAPNPLPPADPRELTFKMEAIGGGLIAYKGPFPFEAPAHGYAPSLTFHMTINDNRPTGYYYLRSRDGSVYASFLISVDLKAEPLISIRYRLNTTGSRVLEP